MIPKKVFTYWEGTRHPYIEYCLKTFKRLQIQTISLTPGNIDDHIKSTGLSENWKKLSSVAQKVDCMRIALIKKYGGAWIDADTVIIKNANDLFNTKNKNMVIKWDKDNVLCNAYLVAEPNNQFISAVFDKINDKLINNFATLYNQHGGVDMGEYIFEQVRKKIQPIIMSRTIFLPVEFRGHPQIWKSNEGIETYIKPDTIGIGLNNSQYSVNIKNMSINDISRQGSLLGDIFRYSLKLGNL